MKKSTGYVLLITCCFCIIACVTCVSILIFIPKEKDTELANAQVSEVSEVPVETEIIPIDDAEDIPINDTTVEADDNGLFTVQSDNPTVFTEEDLVGDMVASNATGDNWELVSGNVYVNCDLSAGLPEGIIDSVREQTYYVLLDVLKESYKFDNSISITSYKFNNSENYAMIAYIIDGTDVAQVFEYSDGTWTTWSELTNMCGTDYMPIIFTKGAPSNAVDLYEIIGENAAWGTYITDYQEDDDTVVLRSPDNRLEIISL